MNYIEIKDKNASELDIFSKATETQLYNSGMFLAESANVIISALDSGFEPVSMLVEKGRI